MVRSTPQPKNNKTKKPSASGAPKAGPVKAALTISRPEMLVNGSDQAFRRLVHSLFVRAVADHLYLSGAFVTAVTNKLMAKGMIEKASHPVDRRRLSLTVTARGAELLERLAPTQTMVNDVQFDCLSAKEFHQLLDMTQRLVDSGDRAIALQRYLAEVNVTPLREQALAKPPAPRKRTKS